ncbi:vacuolar ATPase assembly integral membrane protein vma21 [Basidiobolus ranarum]|uniref:Vacuolar ATPase assembly integral membrane protein vma21 n=1 Tax=Basidiobolus ranarum TaxID=34480 RepID=A0ABR2X5I4_9FUNG
MSSSVSASKMAQVSEVSKSVPSRLVVKILLFTAVILLGPICSYFLTLNSVFDGNRIYAAGFAAVVANVAVIFYIVAAFAEDSGSQEVPKVKES